MRVWMFFEALKKAVLGRLGRSLLDEIEHGERLEQLRRRQELEAFFGVAPEDEEFKTARGEIPSASASQSITYFNDLIRASERGDLLTGPTTEEPLEEPKPRRRKGL